MYDESKNIKRYREKIKRRALLAAGQKCRVCGYSKEITALDFHHVDPTQKDFSLSKMREGHRKSWEVICDELDKCVLVCCRCHTEIHAGVTECPPIQPVDREVTAPDLDTDINMCPVCGESKPSRKRVCSPTCSGKLPRYDWSKMDILEELKTKSMYQLSLEVGCTYNAIRKQVKRARQDSNLRPSV